MNIGYLNVERRIAPRRASVLRKLGISNLVNTAMFDIAAAHEALVRRQAVPERIFADGLVVDVPAGVYHPLPDFELRIFHPQYQGDESEPDRQDAGDRLRLRHHLALYGGQLDVENGRDGHLADRR